MAQKMADPETPRREDEIDERIADQFDPQTRQSLEAVRDRNSDDVALARGLKNAEDEAGNLAGVDKNSDSINNREQQKPPEYKNSFTGQNSGPNQKDSKVPAFLKGSRKKGPLAVIGALLVAGGF